MRLAGIEKGGFYPYSPHMSIISTDETVANSRSGSSASIQPLGELRRSLAEVAPRRLPAAPRGVDTGGSAATNAPRVEEAANAALRNRRVKQVVPGSDTPKHRQGSCAGTSTATHSSDDFRGPFDCMTSLERAREGQSVLLHHTPCALSSSIAAL